jgi:hypothetical protein
MGFVADGSWVAVRGLGASRGLRPFWGAAIDGITRTNIMAAVRIVRRSMLASVVIRFISPEEDYAPCRRNLSGIFPRLLAAAEVFTEKAARVQRR